jgi:hypothetical protein
LDFIFIFAVAKKCLDRSVRRHKLAMILICLYGASVLLSIVGAIIYNSMYVQSQVGVNVT